MRYQLRYVRDRRGEISVPRAERRLYPIAAHASKPP
jgi:hypothetical protein